MGSVLNIDLETFSSNDLKKGGVYRYAEAQDFEILLFAYSLDGAPVKVVDMLASMGEIPDYIEKALFDPTVEKRAYNAAFERVVLTKHFGRAMPPEEWSCTMALAAAVGLPFGLGTVADILKLDTKKDLSGSALIRYFAIPCKPTKTNDQRTRNMPWHDTEKWEKFIDYCRVDVEVEMAVREKVEFFDPGPIEKKIWCLDQKINDYGVELDPVLVKNAIKIDSDYRERLLEEATELTGLSNVNSGAQLKEWLSIEIDEAVTSLKKDAIPQMIKDADSEVVKRVLGIRQEISKTSVKKYTSMVNCMGEGNRARGLLQYYGANRTGRWAGRLIQVQNLVKNKLKDLNDARELVLKNEADDLEMLYGNVPEVLSQLIRTAFVAGKGKKFIVSDLSAIEARVISWLADEKWRLEVFATHGKIYEASGAKMFKIPIEEVTDESGFRPKSKISELALGFAGGVMALLKMGAVAMGVAKPSILIGLDAKGKEIWEHDPILQELVDGWRAENPNIVKMWTLYNNAAITCVKEQRTVKLPHGVEMFVKKNVFFMKLPSGRLLSYMRPLLRPNKFGGEELTYEGMDQVTKKWGRMSTYGGKLVENAVQGTARDVIAWQAVEIDEAGYDQVMLVHDETVAEVPENNSVAIKIITDIMSKDLSWAPGLPLGAKAFETYYYKKD